jgi:hypothetical protein
MRKRRALIAGVVIGGVVAGLAVLVAYVIATGSAGTALTIGLVGLGPAFAAAALVAALSAAAPPVGANAHAVSVKRAAESSTEVKV